MSVSVLPHLEKVLPAKGSMYQRFHTAPHVDWAAFFSHFFVDGANWLSPGHYTLRLTCGPAGNRTAPVVCYQLLHRDACGVFFRARCLWRVYGLEFYVRTSGGIEPPPGRSWSRFTSYMLRRSALSQRVMKSGKHEWNLSGI